MKKIFFAILAIGIGLVVWRQTLPTEQVNVVKTNSPATQPNPSDATFTFDDGEITLKNGVAENEIAPGSTLKEKVEILKDQAYGDLNGDGRNDTALLIVRSGGGSGVFIYVAAYISGVVTYKGSNAIFVGDRISPENLSIKNGVITLEYLDRSPDEPFAAEPTFKVTRRFIIRNGTLMEK